MSRDPQGRGSQGRDQQGRDQQGRSPAAGRGATRSQRGRGAAPPARTAEPRLPSTSRGVALGVLRAVRLDDAYANLLLPARIRRAGLRPDDAALATELAYGTLRSAGLYDRIIERAAARGLDAIDPAALDVLRLGAHQLLATRIPPHAAVYETVELAARVVPRPVLGFLNAVLRRVAERSREGWLAELEAGGTPDARLALETAHPEWIVAALREALDADPAVIADAAKAQEDGAPAQAGLAALLAADNAAPRVSLARLLPASAAGGPTPEGLAPLPYSPVGLSWPGGDPANWPAIAQGAVRVQDEGSQLAALALSRARPVIAGERWLDLCAGPGGKAALLAVEAAAGGAALLANELTPGRAELVRTALAPVAEGLRTSAATPGALPQLEVVEGDGRRFVEQPAAFDRILLDAPCTGLGALRRRPEARWRKDPADLEALTRLQTQLFDAAFVALKPGGLLAYVTCSPHLAETHRQLDAALDRHSRLEPVDTGAVLDGLAVSPLPGIGPGRPRVQLWPHRHGTDAMFIALLTKRAR